MTRRATWGAEWNDDFGPNAGDDLDLHTGGTPGFTFDTGTVRSGTYSARCNSGAGNITVFTVVGNGSTGGAFARTSYNRCCVNVDAMPASTVRIYNVNDGNGIAIVAFRLDSSGVIRLWDEVANVQVGSDGPTISINTWYRLEISTLSNITTGNSLATPVEARVEGSTFATGTLTGTANGFAGSPQAGWVDAPGANKSIYLDDTGTNIDDAAPQNSWLGDGKVIMLVPTADSAVGAGWQKPGGATTNLFGSVANKPAIGVADSTSAADAAKMIRHATNGSTTSYDATMQTYASKGITAADTITVVFWYVVTSSASATQVPSREAQLVSNPAEGAATNCPATSFAAGTYPVGWTGVQGPNNYSPSVTVGTAPVLRLHRVTSSARIVDVCQMSVQLEYVPTVAGPVPYRNPMQQLIVQ